MLLLMMVSYIMLNLIYNLPFSNFGTSLDYKSLFTFYISLTMLNLFIFISCWEVYSPLILIFFAFSGWMPSFVRGIHLPEGLPIFMIPIMFIFELFAVLVRPFTLTMRIFLNLTLGHFVINVLFYNFWFTSLFLFLMVFEVFMAVLHSYVFCLLLNVYHTS